MKDIKKEPVDELYDEAVMVALAIDKLTTQDLQRNLRIGYCRAFRIMEQLRQSGTIL